MIIYCVLAEQEKINRGVTNFYQRDGTIFLHELDAISQFPDLAWRWHNDIPVLKGIYHFEEEFRGEFFEDEFNLEINFPSDYPDKLPLVKEIDNKIPNTFHHFVNGYLCLCTPVEQHLIFAKEPTLKNFINNLLNPYLLSWLWYQRFNKMPWGERRHGSIGIVESYQELLKLNDFQQTILFIMEFTMNKIDRNDDCPCGSGFSFKKCHRKIIINLENSLPREQLANDFNNIIIGGFK